MANPGVLGTYDLSVGTMLDIEPVIKLLSPTDTPLLGGMAGDGRSILPRGEIFEKKYEWLDDVLKAPSSSAAGTITTGATVVNVGATDQYNFEPGDVLYNPTTGEYVYVSAYSSTDSLTITRGYAGSTATTITSGDKLIGVGMALAEGSDPPSARSHDRVDRFNYAQIFGPQQVSVSGTEQVVRKYGLTSTEFDYQLALALKEQAIALNQACYYGIAYAGTVSLGRLMGGMKSFITTNIDAATTTLTESAIFTLMQSCYAAGGAPDRLLVGPKQMITISNFDSTLVRIDNVGPGSGIRGTPVSIIRTPFGELSVCLDRHIQTADAFLINRDDTEISTLRPFQFQPLAKTGDSVKGMIVGEYGFKLRAQNHSGRFSVLT